MSGHAASPETVVRDLRINPERIADRPAWSLKVAKKIRKHREKQRRQVAMQG